MWTCPRGSRYNTCCLSGAVTPAPCGIVCPPTPRMSCDGRVHGSPPPASPQGVYGHGRLPARRQGVAHGTIPWSRLPPGLRVPPTPLLRRSERGVFTNSCGWCVHAPPDWRHRHTIAASARYGHVAGLAWSYHGAPSRRSAAGTGGTWSTRAPREQMDDAGPCIRAQSSSTMVTHSLRVFAHASPRLLPARAAGRAAPTGLQGVDRA